MALLYNEGCENLEEEVIKCFMRICPLNSIKFTPLLCNNDILPVKAEDFSNNKLNDLSNNIFKYQRYEPYNHSRIIFLSNNDEDGVVFLFEENIYFHKYPSKTYLCRLRKISQKATICEHIDANYLGKTLSFNSYDIINRGDSDIINIRRSKNSKHTVTELKYKDLSFGRSTCHIVKTQYIKQNRCMYYLCEVVNGNLSCSNANYGGRLIFINDYLDNSIENRKFLYLPGSCITKDLNFICDPQLCQYKNTNELISCEKLEISSIKNIIPSQGKLEHVPTYMPISHENRPSTSILLATSFMPFLVMLVFIWCFVYKFLRRRKSKLFINISV
ncbi:fam-e protein [Plasmodium gallinaceum]|uniref:Fam-e protein n=1 Tax=Plasmodium gallinaceum TaxID=5849 RepID=A0A1J1GPW3_PLAGA|nr:fam-e protein [Plasmodium gallinaceum]CRG94551.1 fam-e protein [Plasmodium gallinaceum]